MLDSFRSENDDNTVIVECDENGIITCIYLQTAEQKELVNKFPEIMHIDVTTSTTTAKHQW